MKEEIKKSLRRAGFDEAGITSADPLPEDGDRFLRWIASGRSGGMDYLARGARARSDPRAFLDGARSVIVAAAAYSLPDRSTGPIAAYALYPDYHLVLREALMKGVKAVEELDPAARCRVAVDTSPLLERGLACRAGLGRIGYSTNLVTPGFGPCVLLGVIVTTLPLEPDEPSKEPACDQCGRCIEACPTGALSEPFQLDARKCISYLTIEKKGPFDDREAKSIGGWAFGCDLCTAACLEGRTPRLSSGLLVPNEVLRNQDLEGLLDLCEGGFKRNFRDTPLFRTGKGRLIRNIRTAARNLDLPWALT